MSSKIPKQSNFLAFYENPSSSMPYAACGDTAEAAVAEVLDGDNTEENADYITVYDLTDAPSFRIQAAFKLIPQK